MDDTDRLGDEIAEVSAHLNASTHRLLALIRRFDEQGGWAKQGALSCAHWLSWRVGLVLGAGREKVRVARALGTFKQIDEALRRGELSYAQVRAMTRIATLENETQLLEMARSSTASQLERLCRRYRRVKALEQGAGTSPEDRYVWRGDEDDGMVRIDARLRPEEAAVVWKAIDVMRSALRAEAKESRGRRGSDDVSAETSRAASRADALVAMAETYLARAAPDKAVGSPFEVVVHVSAEALSGKDPADVATLEDGTAVPAETARRLSCDCGVVRMTDRPDGTPLDVGRRCRTIPTALRRALRKRDGGCRFPGCTNRLYVDAHHIEHWARGGETKLGNLIELCRCHHRLLHEEGFGLEVLADGSFAFYDAAGKRIEEAPRPPAVPPDPFATIVKENEKAGVAIDPGTNFPDWDGDRMNLSLAVEALLDADGML